MTESENNPTLDLVNKVNIAEYEDNRLSFTSDVIDFINKILVDKYTKYQKYNETRQDFIKHLLEYIKNSYFIK